MTALAHLKIDLDGFNGADSPPLGAWTRVLLDPQVDVTDPAADKVYVGQVSVSLGSDGKPTTANGMNVNAAIGVPLLAGVTYAVSSTALRTTGTVGPLTEGQTYNLADVYVPGAPLTPDQAAALAARVTALEAIPPDHGALTGLGDDDHLIYLTTGRGDARYVQGSDSRLSDARTPTAHVHAISDVTALQTALDGKAPIRSGINAQTGTAYTLALTDENLLVTLTNAGAITVTVPTNATVAFPVGARVDLTVLGAGMATLVGASGVTVNATPSAVTRAQHSGVSLQKVATNTWLAWGDLAG